VNIFILTYFDLAGGSYRLAKAINENTSHNAISARWATGPWSHGGLINPSNEIMHELFLWADVVQIQNTVIHQIPSELLTMKPITFYYRGSDFRDNFEVMKARAKKMGAVESVNFLDLAAIGKIERWIPSVIEDFAYMKASHNGFKVAQCPSTTERYTHKNTREVIDIMQNVPNIQFELICNHSWKEGLRRKGECDAIIDQFKWGYGNSGAEAMSMGIPVLADAHPDIIEQMERRIGYLPFIRCSIDELSYICAKLRADDAYREGQSVIGRHYWETFHSPAAVAKRAIEVFQETIDLWRKRND